MCSCKRLVTFGLVILLISVTAILAEVPRFITYQGRMTDNAGTPFTGSKNLTFRLYNGSGVQIWSSGAVNVGCVDGLFSVRLGESPQPALPSATVWAMDTILSLGIQETSQPEMSPRTRLATTPYAYSSLNGGGWLWDQASSRMTQEHITDNVGIGRSDPAYPLDVHSTSSSGDYVARITNTNKTTHHSLVVVLDTQLCWSAYDAAFFASNRDSNSVAAVFCGTSRVNAVSISNFGSGKGLTVGIGDWTTNPAILATGGLGLLSQTYYAQRAGRFELNQNTSGSNVLEAEYIGSEMIDHRGIWAKSAPSDFYGVGGEFQGGWRGVYGHVNPSGSSSYLGVMGEANGGSGSNYGIYGTASGSGTNYGLYATAGGGSTNWAGYFTGPVYVSGFLTKAGGGFLIDHPVDPDNKLLQHSFVESPDMKNIYDGVVTTDGSGYATVTLPDWFGTLNSDFRYQLTVIDVFAQAIIAEKITNNHFTIRTDKPDVEVSWQVTGIRKDAWARTHPMAVELTKSPGERGKYLNPDAYGLARDKAMYADPDQSPEAQAKIKSYEESKAACAKLATDHTQPDAPCKQTKE